MTTSSLKIIREARHWLQSWLDSVHKCADPSSRRIGELNQISQRLSRVDGAIQVATPELVASTEWAGELADYRKTLLEVRAQLGNLEILLRIRKSQMNTAQAQLKSVSCWADLAKHIV
jgi:hypothetical protein